MKESFQILEKMAQPPEIHLYKELLECLEHEWQALITSQEDAILACAARKEQILSQIAQGTNPEGQKDEVLNRLKRQAAGAQFRNHRLIVAALETIQDFFGYLQSAPPGIYHSAGKVESAPANSFFYRQA